MLFSELNLSPPILQAIAQAGYVQTTPIQEKAIPSILQGRDLLGMARTGTGKTAAFMLPILEKLLKGQNDSASPAKHPVRALILLPTRELALQVYEQTQIFSKYTQLKSCVVFGGMDMQAQSVKLKKGAEILVATPGRLLDFLTNKMVNLQQLEVLVLDEADRMLDIGFLPDLTRILTFLPRVRNTLLFSATFPNSLQTLTKQYLNQPIRIDLVDKERHNIQQIFYRTKVEDKFKLLTQLLPEVGQAFVFVNSKYNCQRIAKQLRKQGWKVEDLHGDKSQNQRMVSLASFKSGKVDYLICTDVAARGLDIKEIPAVINYDLPFNSEDYIHRIGRTGRAGAAGLALSMTVPVDEKRLGSLEKLLKVKIEIKDYQEKPKKGLVDAEAVLDSMRTVSLAESKDLPHSKPMAEGLVGGVGRWLGWFTK
ncbi:MAG: DEAD/DEAH box helicase [Gammaproteobacteria bacterium]|nr:DEAD/DEAH box helicase [Gammaproteobacteria bacterium]